MLIHYMNLSNKSAKHRYSKRPEKLNKSDVQQFAVHQRQSSNNLTKKQFSRDGIYIIAILLRFS